MRQFSSKLYTLQLPMKRGVDVIYDETMEGPFSTMLATSHLIFAAGFALSVILGAMGREVVVPGVLATTFLLSASTRAVAGLGFLIVSGNVLAYCTIWITTPQVDLISFDACPSGALRIAWGALVLFICITELNHSQQTIYHCSLCNILTHIDVSCCMQLCCQ
jgi:hypothetical protein